LQACHDAIGGGILLLLLLLMAGQRGSHEGEPLPLLLLLVVVPERLGGAAVDPGLRCINKVRRGEKKIAFNGNFLLIIKNLNAFFNYSTRWHWWGAIVITYSLHRPQFLVSYWISCLLWWWWW
jgi:hypothetical protein